MPRRRQGQAQALAEKFREMSVAEFFAKNRELAGFSNPVRALYQTIRELVENSLDATDTHRILSSIYIRIEEARSTSGKKIYRVTVEDNGIGIPPDHIANAFGRVLYSSKYIIRQTRGMYGLGVKAAILYGQLSAGRPVRVITSTRGSDYVYYRALYIDTRRNEPRIVEAGQWRKKGSWHGTRVTIELEGDWSRSRSRILEYIRRTAVIAPYAEIMLETPEGMIHFFPRSTTKMPKPPREAKPHPHGIDLEQLKTMIHSSRASTLLELLSKEFQSVGEKTALAFLKEVGLDPRMNPRLLLRKENQKLLVALADGLKSYKGFRAPRSDYLSPIGEDLIRIGLKSMYSPEWVDAVTRSPRAYQGHPFIVEAGIAYGGGIEAREEPLLLRYANKIPLLYEEREDVIYKVVSSINWRIYNVDFPAPLVVLVHIASTKVPYKGVGKESISEVPEIESEVRNAVQEVGRRLKSYLYRKGKQEEAKRKIVTIAKYIPEVARSLAMIAKPPEKWSPPRDGDEKTIAESLVKLVARHVPVPQIDGDERPADKVIWDIIENVRVE